MFQGDEAEIFVVYGRSEQEAVAVIPFFEHESVGAGEASVFLDVEGDVADDRTVFHGEPDMVGVIIVDNTGNFY